MEAITTLVPLGVALACAVMSLVDHARPRRLRLR